MTNTKPVFIPIVVLSLLLFSCAAPSVSTTKEKEEKKPEKPGIQKTSERYIKDIKAESFPDKTVVEIEAEGPMKYTAFKLTEPLRLIVDISDMKTGPDLSPIDINGEIVDTIKYQYFSVSNITRIEIGLKKIALHEIIRHGKNKIAVNLFKPAGTEKEEAAKPAPEDIPVIQRDESEKIEIASRLKEPAAQPNRFRKDRGHKRKLHHVDRHVEESLEESLKKQGLDTEKKYTGRLISLDFQDAEITNIIRLIAEVSGLNVITGDEVKGKINLKLIDVPWDQALDIILRSKGLGMEKEGNILRVLPIAKLEKERETKIKEQQAKREAIKAKENIEEMFTEVIPINYASADELLKNLEKLKSERGSIDIDERTNTLIIRDIKKNLAAIKSLIGTLDLRTAQVVIEARIVEISRSFSRELGIQWGGMYNKSTSYAFPNNIGIRGGIAPATSDSSLSLMNTMPGGGSFLMHMPAAVGSGTGGAVGITLGHIAGSYGLDITLSALEDTGQGKILSNPKITTEDNQEAVIESGRSIPYATVSQSGTSVQFVDATINLTVTPHITQDDYVSMKITATKNDADFAKSVQGTPSIIKKKATTQVLIKDGDTTVIGGLYTNDNQESLNAIPWFSKIPIVGWLFKKRAKTKSSTELLIFITPKILRI